MKISFANGSHLSYCTNIHPGENAAETLENIRKHVIPVKQKFCPDTSFGVGLRLSYEACREFSANINSLQELCRQNDLYVFTINGFIYGHFHKKPVKENVYLPDWTSHERVQFSNLLADVLNTLLPEETPGTISTVPIGFKNVVCTKEQVMQAANNIIKHVMHLYSLEKKSNKKIMLCLEPEPGCYIETIDETVDFFNTYLFTEENIDRLSCKLGESLLFCENFLKSHVGICYDTCHMAIEYEEAAEALAKLKENDICVGKIQVSSAIQVKFCVGDSEIIDYLSLFRDKIYLHQVVQKQNNVLQRFTDLPEALESLKLLPLNTKLEWRIHFHIPIFLSSAEKVESTQRHIIDTIEYLRSFSLCQHYEVETYTWDVLPLQYKKISLHDSLVRELEWLKQLLLGNCHADSR